MIKRNEDSLRDLWDDIKKHSHFTGHRRRKERKEQRKTHEDKIPGNFPNLGKDTDIRVQETKGVSNMMNPKKNTSKHTVIKMQKSKDKKRILKGARKTNKLHTRELS